MMDIYGRDPERCTRHPGGCRLLSRICRSQLFLAPNTLVTWNAPACSRQYKLKAQVLFLSGRDNLCANKFVHKGGVIHGDN